MYMQENCTGLSEKMTTVQCMVSFSANYNTQFLFKTSDLQVTNVIVISFLSFFFDILDVQNQYTGLFEWTLNWLFQVQFIMYTYT